MTRRLVAMVVIAATLMVAAPAGASNAPMAITGPSPARSLANAVRVAPPKPPPPVPTVAQQVVDLLNAERAREGLGPLALDARLTAAADAHSRDQSTWSLDRWYAAAHTGSNGSNAGQRITAAGYVWTGWAENVAFGQRDAAAVVSAWMNSAGHRKNNLGSYTHVGVGLAFNASGTPYWTMVFANPG